MRTSAILAGTQAREAVEGRQAPALAVILLGAMMLFVMGFLNVPAVHNATHDSRHAAGFPCH